MTAQVLYPGMYTTLQDRGRVAGRPWGIRVCGTMDRFAAAVANMLVGNKVDCVTLECTLIGPKLRFTISTIAAVAGGRCELSLDGYSIADHTVFQIPAGAELNCHTIKHGSRAYIAVAGGWCTPRFLDSGSSDSQLPELGLLGRSLRAGDELAFNPTVVNAQFVGRGITPLYTKIDETVELRVLPGLHWEEVSTLSQQQFLSGIYQVRANSDRMGLRLSGPVVTRMNHREIRSLAVDYGTIQLPADGQPLILGADHPTTGGYPIMAIVIEADRSRLGQLGPGQAVRFKMVDFEAAIAARLAEATQLNRLRHALS